MIKTGTRAASRHSPSLVRHLGSHTLNIISVPDHAIKREQRPLFEDDILEAASVSALGIWAEDHGRAAIPSAS
jgi:hypothetical protein